MTVEKNVWIKEEKQICEKMNVVDQRVKSENFCKIETKIGLQPGMVHELSWCSIYAESGLNKVEGRLMVGALGNMKGEVIDTEDGGDNTGGEEGKPGTKAFRSVDVDVVCVEAVVRHAEAGWCCPGELTCFSLPTSISSAIALIFPRYCPLALKIEW